jgi:hypothetical protein
VYQNPRFVVWTDCSSAENGSKTLISTGFVIRDFQSFLNEDGISPPLYCSNIYRNSSVSKGELKAGYECLSFLARYCEAMDIEPEDCKVELKTDCSKLAWVLNTFNGEEERSKKNNKLFKRLKKMQNLFGEVLCQEIRRDTNVAHNVSYMRLARYRNGRKNGWVKFEKYYKNPELCIEKNKSLVHN